VIRRIGVSLSLSLALAALLVMFTPFLREFSSLHIQGEWLAFGSFIVGILCFLGVSPARAAVVAMLAIMCIGSLVEGLVIALPALLDLVPNPVAYINLAEQQVLIGCFIAGPFVLAGGVLGGVLRTRLRRSAVGDASESAK
jgi:hypothetical protein